MEPLKRKKEINRLAVRYDAKKRNIKTPYDHKDKKLLRQLLNGESRIERDFTIGIITDDKFCSWASEDFPLQCLGSSTARMITSWVYEFYYEYNRAPKQDFESLYFDKLGQGKIPKDQAEELETEVLPGLSDQFKDEGIDIRYLKIRTDRYLNRRMAEKRLEEARGYLDNNELDIVNELLNLVPPVADTISQFIRTIQQMEDEGVEKPKILLSPWLREGETNLLYSEAGVGKSLLAILIGYLLGLEEFDKEECEIGKWQVKHPTGTLYIDGELGEAEMIDRMRQFSWLGSQLENMQLRTLSIPSYQIKTGKDMHLNERSNQRKIIEWLRKNPNYKFLVIDSVSTTFGLESENDNSEWNKKINPFLKDLRALGVAHLIQHHAGKDGKLRGASAMNAMAHNQFRLSNHERKESGQAWFLVDNSGKQRAAGDLMKPFYIKFIKTDDVTEWEVTDYDGKSSVSKSDRIMCELVRGREPKWICEKYGVSASYVSQQKRKAKQKGYLDDDGKPTPDGNVFMEEFIDQED